jgi:hypothetical protein
MGKHLTKMGMLDLGLDASFAATRAIALTIKTRNHYEYISKNVLTYWHLSS